MSISQKQISAVIALSGPKRYDHFIKTVCDQEYVWSLFFEDGWAVACDNDGTEGLPLWPHPEYARLCAVEEWRQYEPKTIPIHELLEKWLPSLKENGRATLIFITPEQQGVLQTCDELAADLQEELRKYE